MVTDEELSKLKQKHNVTKLYQLTHPALNVSVLVRKPTTFEYAKWADRKSDPDQRSKASRQLFFDCVVHPEGDELDTLMTEYPALPDTFAGEVLELAGAAAKIEKKAL